MKRLVPSVTISDCPSEVFCTRFSPDGRFLAAGCGDGAIRVFNSEDGKLAYTLMQPINQYGFGMPCTAIRFRPVGSGSKTKNVLVAVNSNGTVEHWHMTSGKCLHAIMNEKNQLYALDYSPEGMTFATAGKDKTVRIYDETTKKEIIAMTGGHGTLAAGHSNRIFSLKFYPDDENLILSGGWDNTLQIWDSRVGHAVQSIYGPHIAGDAVDINPEKYEIITGSWRPDNPLELWDLRSGDKICNIPWRSSNGNSINNQDPPCFLYAAQFSKQPGSKLIAAGGSGANEAKVFNHGDQNKLVGTIAGLRRGVFTLDFSPIGDKLVVAGADSAIRIVDIHDYVPGDKSVNTRPSTPTIRLDDSPRDPTTKEPTRHVYLKEDE